MIFGIDGGGTNSRIRLEDDKGNLFAEAIGSSTNIYSVGAKTVEYNLKIFLNRKVFLLRN